MIGPIPLVKPVLKKAMDTTLKGKKGTVKLYVKYIVIGGIDVSGTRS